MEKNNKYAIILDSGECVSTINGQKSYNWKNETIMNLAGKTEWFKYNFYPSNGLIGEVVDVFENPIWNFKIYVLFINDKFYVPMSENGIKLLSYEDLEGLKINNSLDGIPENVKVLHLMQETLNKNVEIIGNKYDKPSSVDLLKTIDDYQAYIAEAPFYCRGAQKAVNHELINNSFFQTESNLQIEKTKSDFYYQNINISDLAKLTSRFTKEKVLKDGDNWNDLNSVGWFMGIYCYLWKNSVPICNNDFENIFISSWVEYFNQ